MTDWYGRLHPDGSLTDIRLYTATECMGRADLVPLDEPPSEVGSFAYDAKRCLAVLVEDEATRDRRLVREAGGVESVLCRLVCALTPEQANRAGLGDLRRAL